MLQYISEDTTELYPTRHKKQQISNLNCRNTFHSFTCDNTHSIEEDYDYKDDGEEESTVLLLLPVLKRNMGQI